MTTVSSAHPLTPKHGRTSPAPALAAQGGPACTPSADSICGAARGAHPGFGVEAGKGLCWQRGGDGLTQSGLPWGLLAAAAAALGLAQLLGTHQICLRMPGTASPVLKEEMFTCGCWMSPGWVKPPQPVTPGRVLARGWAPKFICPLSSSPGVFRMPQGLSQAGVCHYPHPCLWRVEQGIPQ